MGKQINIKATLSENVNKAFRIKTKFYHIIHKHHDVKRYPIIINNFNRLEYLQQQIEWLLKVGQTNLHIIDNASTYEPLLRYYKTVPATVYMLDKNVGHESFWRTHLHQRFGRYYHVYADPDVLPYEKSSKKNGELYKAYSHNFRHIVSIIHSRSEQNKKFAYLKQGLL